MTLEKMKFYQTNWVKANENIFSLKHSTLTVLNVETGKYIMIDINTYYIMSKFLKYY